MGNLLKGLSEILSNNGSIIDALTGSQAGSDSNIFNLSEGSKGSSSPTKQGNSHIFDEKGNFLRSQSIVYEPSETDRGSNVYIEISDKNKSLVLLPNYPLSEQNEPNIIKVFYAYATSVNIPFNENKKIEFKVLDATDGKRGTMASNGINIFINTEGGKMADSLSDYYNIRNMMIHEDTHRINFEKKINDGEGEGVFEHAKVYFEQIKHPTFKKCTIRTQEGVVNSMCNNYLSKAITEMGLQDDTIQKFVDSVNLVLKSYKSELNFYFKIDFIPDLYPPYKNLKLDLLRKN